MAKVDTIIVGGGLAGSILAMQHQLWGKSYVLFDGNWPKASSVAAGIFNPMVFRRLVKSWMADDILPYAEYFYKQFETDLNAHFFYPLSYYKLLGKDEAEFWLRRAQHGENKPYLSSVIEQYEELKHVHHPYGAAKVFHAGWLNLKVLLNTSHELWEKQNLIRHINVDYDRFQFNRAGVQYGEVIANRVVFCEGCTVNQNPWFQNLPFKHTKGEILTIRSEQLKIDSIVNKKIFILPLGNSLFRVGATYNWSALDNSPTEEGRTELEQSLQLLLKVPYQLVDHKAGLRPTTNDRRPLLGAHPAERKCFIFNGLGSKGVMLAPYFANHLMEHIFKGKPLNHEVDTNRYIRYFI